MTLDRFQMTSYILVNTFNSVILSGSVFMYRNKSSEIYKAQFQ